MKAEDVIAEARKQLAAIEATVARCNEDRHPPPEPGVTVHSDDSPCDLCLEREADAKVIRALVDLVTRQPQEENYQQRVRTWVLDCFGDVIANDMTERSFRFLEEAMELCQSIGCTKEQAMALVDYVYSRPAGELGQEVGGVIVTLAALTSAAGIDLQAEAERELTRVTSPEVTAKIRRKQASKRGVVSHAAQAALPGEWSDATSVLPHRPHAQEQEP